LKSISHHAPPSKVNRMHWVECGLLRVSAWLRLCGGVWGVEVDSV
jgi:hypothetical protein